MNKHIGLFILGALFTTCLGASLRTLDVQNDSQTDSQILLPGLEFLQINGTLFSLKPQARADEEGTPQVANMNNFIDTYVNLTKSNYKGDLSAFAIPEFKNPFIQIKNMVIYGLDSVHRDGDATLTQLGETSSLVDAQMQLDNVSAIFEWGYGFYLMHKGSAKVSIDTLAFRVKLYLPEGKVQQLQILKLDGLKLERVTGFTVVFNWFARWYYNLFINLLKPLMILLIERLAVR